MPMNHYARVSELLDQYRLYLTGSLESRNDNEIFDFIYHKGPKYQTEILDFFYVKGYQDGQSDLMKSRAR